VTPILIAPRGGPVDACWHEGRIVIAYQDGPGPEAMLVQRSYTPQGAVLSSVTYPLGSDVGAFPRLLSAHGSVWLIYREGKSLGGRAVLRRDGVEVWRSSWECGGNDPVCFGEMSGRVAFAAQQFGVENLVFGGTLDKPKETLHRIGVGAPDGLHAFNGAAGVTLIKDVRGSVVGMTRPTWALGLVAGEHPDAGVLVRDIDDGREFLVFAGQAGATPRLSVDFDTQRFAVVTWGELRGIDYGVRLAVFTEADLVAPAPVPAPVWDAINVVVDCGRFFNIDVSTVPREAADGQCWQAHRSGDEVFIVKGSDPRMVEILRLTDDDVRLAYDATDSRYPRAWRLNDGSK